MSINWLTRAVGCGGWGVGRSKVGVWPLRGLYPWTKRQSLSQNQHWGVGVSDWQSTAGWRLDNVCLCSICEQAAMRAGWWRHCENRVYTFEILNLLWARAAGVGRGGWLRCWEWAVRCTQICRKENVRSEGKNLIAADSSWGESGEFKKLASQKQAHPCQPDSLGPEDVTRQTSLLGEAGCFWQQK